MPYTVAMVVSTVGYHWEEVVGAYDEFTRAGWTVEFYTVNGARPRIDPVSIKMTGPLSMVGLGTSSTIAPQTALGQEVEAKLRSVRSISELNLDHLDALYLPGGHGCLFDLNENEALHAIIGDLYRRGKVLSGVCHATSTFAFVKNGAHSIIKGKKITGFPHILDQILVAVGGVDRAFLPIPFSNDAALRAAGAAIQWSNQLAAALNPSYVRADWPFVTGMGPKAARKVAKMVITRAAAHAAVSDAP